MSNDGVQLGNITGNVTIQQAGGDIVAGNKTIINQIIQAAKQIVTAPYKFLASYDISDKDIFFGRDAVIDQLVGKMPRYKTLVINGRSGSGKTSLINAGLIPRLAENGYHYLSFRDYTDPLRQLREYVAQDHLFNAYTEQTTSLTQFLKTVTRQQHIHLVIIFDQFERFFVNVLPTVRTQFIQEIKACLDSDLSGAELDLVFALREDFFGAFVIEFETQMPTFFNETDRFNLLPLNQTEARAAIMEPLWKIPYKIGYNECFVDKVLLPGLMGESSGGRAIDPPHLQIVCNQLYQAVIKRHAAKLEKGGLVEIDRPLYQELGETRGILRTYLDDFIDRTAHRDAGGRDVLRSMLKLMMETTGTRKFVSFRELKTGLPDVQPAAIEQHVREFQDGRIIETRGAGEAARYSLSHEVMVAKVREWFDERELERKRAQETLERGLAEWKSTEALLNEKQVSKIHHWLAAETFSPEAEQLLQASETAYTRDAQEKAERERKLREEEEGRRKAEQEYAEEQKKRAEDAESHVRQQGRSLNWIRKLAVGLIGLVAIAFWFASNTWVEQQNTQEKELIAVLRADEAKQQQRQAEQARQNAEQQKQEADRRAMLSLAQTLSFQALDQLVQHNGPRAALLARQAYLIHQDYQGQMLAQMDNALRRTIEAFYFQTSVFNHSDTAIKPNSGPVMPVAFSPDSKFLATGDEDGTVRVWDLTQPVAAPRLFKGHEKSVSSVVFSPDGARLASGSYDNTVRVWDLIRPGSAPIVLRGHASLVSSVAFSPNGSTLASGSWDRTVQVWDLTQPTATPRVFNEPDGVWSVAFSPDGTHLASGGNKVVRLWDLAQPTAAPHVFTGYEHYVTAVAFSPDGNVLASGSWDRTVRICGLTQPSAAPRILGRHEGFVTSVAFSPDGKRLASGSYDKTVRVWEVSTAIKTDLTPPAAASIVLNGHEHYVASVAFSPDGTRLASGSWDKTVRVWNLTQPSTALRVLAGHNSQVYAVAFSPDGRILASGTADDTVRLWDLTNPAATPLALSGQGSYVSSLAFSPDGRYLAAGEWNKTIRLWDLTQLTTAPRILTGHEAKVYGVAFSPDGTRLASSSSDNTVRVWDITQPTAAPIVLRGHTWEVPSVAFSPDGHFLVSGSWDATVRVWDLTQPTATPRVLRGHQGGVNGVAFSPNGRFIVSGGSDDQTLRVWDLAQPDAVSRILVGLDGGMQAVAFSPDGKYVASGGREDKTVRLWDLTQPTAAPIVLSGHEHYLSSVAFSPDGTRLASCSWDQTVRIWNVQTEELSTLICEQAGHNLTWDEWQHFVSSEIPYARTCPNLPVHHSVFEAARNLAKTGKLDEAKAIFQHVLKLDSNVTLDPTAEANKWRTQGLVEEGQNLVKEGKIDSALSDFNNALGLDHSVRFDLKNVLEAGRNFAKAGNMDTAKAIFQLVLKLDPSVTLDPTAEANKWRAPGLLEQGVQLAKEGQIKDALTDYADARKLDPTLNISAQDWNELCWNGSLHGAAAEVLDACEQAVKLVPENGGIRDSRGLARALTGNITGAIEDFQAFAAQTNDEKAKGQRQQWIAVLQKGENPFTPEVLEQLRLGN